MKTPTFLSIVQGPVLGIGLTIAGFLGFGSHAAAAPPAVGSWVTVVNNNDLIPDTERNFHSYNQPSVNAVGLVAFRARSEGWEQPITGVFTRALTGGAIGRVADRDTEVPSPNNTHYPPNGPLTTFIDFPSFPRIASGTSAIVTRGDSLPVWTYSVGWWDLHAGTSGVFATSSNGLVTGASLLGAVPAPKSPVIGVNYFPYFAVPDAPPATRFDAFSGPPTITDQQVIAFKGSYVEHLTRKSGVYFRDLNASGGLAPVQLIANVNMPIPNLSTGFHEVRFGFLGAPSAAGGSVVFTGSNKENAPTSGGIYLAPLVENATLTTLVSIGGPVPDVPEATFKNFGESLAFDGRFVAFWATWDDEERTLWLDEPKSADAELVKYYRESVGNDFPVTVPVHQGIFLHDTATGITRMIAQTGTEFDDFLYWDFSGHLPEQVSSEELAGEWPHWESTAFLAVSSTLQSGPVVAFKARTGGVDAVTRTYANPVDGIYLGDGTTFQTVVDNTMPGSAIDPEAPEGSIISGLGLEREGFRGNHLAITATMTSAPAMTTAPTEESFGGIYATTFAEPAQHGVSMRASHHKRQAVFVVKNTGSGTDSFHLTKHARNQPSSPLNPNPMRLSITYFLNGRNLTAAFREGRVHVTLGPGETAQVVGRVRPIGQELDHLRRVRLTAVATCDPAPATAVHRHVTITLPAREQ